MSHHIIIGRNAITGVHCYW